MTSGSAPELERSLGVRSATLLGVGSIFGTGVFVSIGIAAGITGPSVVLAIAIAACVALCNALSSAQLAAIHPVSGGTYEYGYRFLNPALGFTAGWMFLAAKSASAATAALGAAAYGLHLAGIDGRSPRTAVAFLSVVLLTWLTTRGMKRSVAANSVIVGMTVLTLLAFAIAALASFDSASLDRLQPAFPTSPKALFHASAIMFVAYAGYGRVATLGEEVRDPGRTIPRAILATLVLSAALYLLVAVAAIGTVGAAGLSGPLGEAATPLEFAASALPMPWLRLAVALGAITAMVGVLLNLILGLSRVALAMGRRRDLPRALAVVSSSGTPLAATWGVGVLIAGLSLIGDVRTTWSFSAFTVLIYYSITNLSALRLGPDERLYSPLFSVAGLIGCLSLAAFIPPSVLVAGFGLIAAGLAFRVIY
jgi:APA family basic amino acid/polyamine antiporter